VWCVQTLRDLAAQFKARPFSYFWVEGAKQPALEANLGVGGHAAPPPLPAALFLLGCTAARLLGRLSAASLHCKHLGALLPGMLLLGEGVGWWRCPGRGMLPKMRWPLLLAVAGDACEIFGRRF
jgi:hypothetical protein